ERWKILGKVPDDSCDRRGPDDGDAYETDQGGLPPAQTTAWPCLNFDEPFIAWHYNSLLRKSITGAGKPYNASFQNSSFHRECHPNDRLRDGRRSCILSSTSR